MKQTPKNTCYYAAYGSNLDPLQMEDRCPDAKMIGIAVLKDYQLLFKGVGRNCHLTIEPKGGGVVPLGVFEISEEDERSLDRYEGYPYYYRKECLRLTLDDGKQIDAFVYIMNQREQWKKGFPSNIYYHGVVRGYEYFGFNIHILEQAYFDSAGIIPDLVRITKIVDGRLISYPVYDGEFKILK